MYEIVAEKPTRVTRKQWRNKQCAIAYCRILQNRWKNEYFKVQRLRGTHTPFLRSYMPGWPTGGR